MHKNIEYLNWCSGIEQYLYETNLNILSLDRLLDTLCSEKNRFEKNFPVQDFDVILNFKTLEKEIHSNIGFSALGDIKN